MKLLKYNKTFICECKLFSCILYFKVDPENVPENANADQGERKGEEKYSEIVLSIEN